MSKKKVKPSQDWITNAGALGIGAPEIWAAAPPHRTTESVRCSGTFTVELEALADWLMEGGVDAVAMEVTKVDWIPLFEILEGRVESRSGQPLPHQKRSESEVWFPGLPNCETVSS